MQTDCLGHISTIPVNYIQGKPYYAYLSNVASGLDACSSSYISPTILIWWRSKNANYGTLVLMS